MEIPVPARLQRLLRAAGGVHVVARLLQDAAHDATYPALLLDDEDLLAAAVAADSGTSSDGLTRWTAGSGRASDSHAGAMVAL